MITTKTVLVLGAGASAPYDFPTGGTLVHRLTAIEDPDTLYQAGVDPTERDRFLREIVGSDISSIDKFLELRPEFREIGRLVLAYTLLRAERKSLTMFGANNNEHWYKILKGRMETAFDRIGDNRLKIITFNYDRSLEYYLCTRLCNTFGKPPDECGAKLALISILHVYGGLGTLPWTDGLHAVPYDQTPITPGMIQRAGQNIKVMHEGSEDAVQRNFEEAKEWLKWADRILFLGFGFHEDNVERLALASVLKPKQRISSTCYSLENTNRNGVEYCTEWAKRPERLREPKLARATIRFPGDDTKCYEFLHRYADLS